MSRLWQTTFCLAAIIVAFSASAQPAAPSVSPQISASITNLMPPAPQSPVTFFRQLLAMTPPERNKNLASRPPVSRARILAKVHEYLELDPNERELRLRATELRWYLTPLLQMSPTNRAARVAQVPPELQDLVNTRLAQWDVLPPNLQREFIANDQTLSAVAHVEMPAPPSPDPEQQRVADQVREFFDLTPGEKQKLLGTLSDSERAQMEKTLKSFDQLPLQQRVLCIRNYAKFAGMSSSERAEFLKNAESWSKLSPQERQTWRDLVAQVPLWPSRAMLAPPLPPGVMPPPAKPIMKVGVATNDK